jgi:hypothetical protein
MESRFQVAMAHFAFSLRPRHKPDTIVINPKQEEIR